MGSGWRCLLFHGSDFLINFSQLPKWFNRNLWVKQVMQSGLKGKYVIVIKEGWITKIKSLDIDLPIYLSIDYKNTFRNEYEDVQELGEINSKSLANIIWRSFALELVFGTINNSDNFPYLHHYYLTKLSDWYNYYYKSLCVTIYHDNDAIARQTMSASKDERVVIYEVSPTPGWSKPLQWNPKGESYD